MFFRESSGEASVGRAPKAAVRRPAWVRWLAVVAILVAAYAALGFWGVPFMLRHELPALARDDLDRQAAVGEVRFNPFTLRLQAQGLRLAERDGAPLLSIGELALQLAWRSIVDRAWTFGEIRIGAPQANLVIAPDGRFNLAELLDTVARRWPAQPSSDHALPRLVVGRFALEQGKVDFNDKRAGYANVLAPIEFTLNDFSTLPGRGDRYQFSAKSTHGGTVQWRGEATLNPIRGSGELTLQDVSLPELAVYLKPYTRARLAAGRLRATVPYRFAYADGTFDAGLAGAAIDLRDLAIAREGAGDSFASLTQLAVTEIVADWRRRQISVGQVRAEGGKLAVRRDAKGELDLASLMVEAAGPQAAPPPKRAVAVDDWNIAVKQVLLDQVAVTALDESVQPPLKLAADRVRLQMQLSGRVGGPEVALKVSGAAGSAAGVALARGAAIPVKVTALGFEGGEVDLAAHRAVVGRVYAQGGALQVARDRQGRIDLAELAPRPGATAAPAGEPWQATARRVELSGFAADVKDEGTGITVHLKDVSAEAQGAGSDLKRPVAVKASLRVAEGGQLGAHGTVVPATGAVDATVRVDRLALAPLQPLLRQHVKLHVAQGSVSAQGRLTTGEGTARSPRLRYAGSFNVAGLVLKEDDGDVFASWKNVGAERLTANLGPDLVDIPEVRIADADAKLIIEDDRSFNAARLLVQPPGNARPVKVAAPAPGPAAAGEAFPVRVHRVRVSNARLDFTDLSLRPQFAAKIYELNGVVTGLSTKAASRSQIELDGRVDEFGMVRVRGDLNPFAPADNTDVNVVFRNVDMVPASPYSMKFAGYKVAEGKISLDLQYKVKDRQLQGDNRIVIDRLTLGERVDSPDALKLPLQLAIAILKDKDGRIELGLPVTGDLSDPQFSYGAIIWKALGNLLTKIVTAPFRALGSLFGGGGDKLEAVDFDAGSNRLLPPEREKLKQVARILGNRPQLKLSVPSQYGETADGAALRARAVRMEVARRAGLKVAAGEDPGPLDFGSREVRAAVRELFVARFGEGELDKQKQAAERATPAAAGRSAKEAVPLWQRVGKVLQGEPQVADAAPFYNGLLQRLDATQPLPADALKALGQQRAEAIRTALGESGVDASRVVAAAPETTDAAKTGPVALKLSLRAD